MEFGNAQRHGLPCQSEKSGARENRRTTGCSGERGIPHPRQRFGDDVRERDSTRKQVRQPRRTGQRRAMTEQPTVAALFHRMAVRQQCRRMRHVVSMAITRSTMSGCGPRGRQCLRHHRRDDRDPHGNHRQPGDQPSMRARPNHSQTPKKLRAHPVEGRALIISSENPKHAATQRRGKYVRTSKFV